MKRSMRRFRVIAHFAWPVLGVLQQARLDIPQSGGQVLQKLQPESQFIEIRSLISS